MDVISYILSPAALFPLHIKMSLPVWYKKKCTLPLRRNKTRIFESPVPSLASILPTPSRVARMSKNECKRNGLAVWTDLQLLLPYAKCNTLVSAHRHTSRRVTFCVSCSVISASLPHADHARREESSERGVFSDACCICFHC